METSQNTQNIPCSTFHKGNASLSSWTKALLFIALLMSSAASGFSQCTTAPGFGYTTGNVPFGTSNNWANPNFVDLDDQVYARVKLERGETSKYLLVKDFRFSIPANATIQGVTVEVQKRQDVITDIIDASVRLSMNGVPVGNDKALPTIWAPADVFSTYGGPVDTWGLNLKASDIMDPDFGFLISATRIGGFAVSSNSFHAYIDQVRVTVWYDDGTNCLLPVTWGGLSAREEGQNEMLLNWTTLSEVNNNYFDIERSTNGEDFDYVGNMPALGDGGSVTQYEFLDETAPTGTLFYRVRQIDQDGNSSYSPVIRTIASNYTGNISLEAWPNPAPNGFALSLAGENLNGELRLTRPDGVTVWNQTLSRETRFSTRIDMNGMAHGIYFLTWNSLSAGNQMIKIVH